MNLQPTLADRQIALRPLQPQDYDALYAVARDPLIWAVHPASDRWQPEVFDRYFAESLASGGALLITDVATGAAIGSSRYELSRAERGEVEIGWTFLSRDHWGGGSNAALKRLMIAHALIDFERVIFVVGESNVRSRRAMEKIGGCLTPRIIHRVMQGESVAHVVFAIDRAGFAAGPLMRGSDWLGD